MTRYIPKFRDRDEGAAYRRTPLLPFDPSEPTEAERIQDLVDAGALFAVSHSGGKDSQAMMIRIADLVPADQVIAIHAPLGDVEWPGTVDHIRATTYARPSRTARPS